MNKYPRPAFGPVVAAVALATAALGAGCAAPVQLQPVKVPVPVECKVAKPERPVMPSDALNDRATLDAIVQAMAAEIELREAYEIKQGAALDSCTRPIEPPA